MCFRLDKVVLADANILLRAGVVIGQPQSHMDFGPVVKPLGITMKTEGGKVVKTSDVVRSQATREFRKRGKSPQSPN